MNPDNEITRVPQESSDSRLYDAEAPAVAGSYTTVESREFVLEKLWRVLVKRKWVIVVSSLIFATFATIGSFRMTPMYDAASQITINKETNDRLGLRENSSVDDFWDYTVELETQTKILQSEALAAQVLRDYQLDKNPYFRVVGETTPKTSVVASNQGDPQEQDRILAILRSGLRVTPIPRTRIIEIHFISPDPKVSAFIANAFANSYIEMNMRTKFETSMQTSDWISKQLSDLKLKVETSQEKLVRYEREHEIVGIDDKQNIVTSKLDELNKELTSAESDRIQKEANYRLASSGDTDLIVRLEPNSVLEKLRIDRATVQSQLAQMATTFGPSYPRVVELKTQLDDLDRQIKAETGKMGQRIKSDYLVALQREKMLRNAFEKQKQDANSLNESAIEYDIIKHDLDSSRQLYDGLLQHLKEAGVTAGLRSNNIRIVDPARPPMAPYSPNKLFNIGIGLLIGLFGGVVFAFAQESMDNTVRTPEQIELISGWPSLGIIPENGSALRNSYYRLLKAEDKLPSRSGDTAKSPELALIVHSQPRSEIAESYRALRTSILLSSLGGPPKIIMFTSGLPQEGKTTTSLNSATVLAQRGSRVLLIDADLRRPKLHQILGLPSSLGLSNLLTSSATPDEVVLRTQIPNVYCVSAGSVPPHPAELLASDLMKQHLEVWREQFDHVIIDTPPVLSVTDAVMLSAYAESTIIVVRAGKTRKEALLRVHSVLTQVKTRVLGVVINGVNMGSPEHYYYYYGERYGDSRYYRDTAKPESTEHV